MNISLIQQSHQIYKNFEQQINIQDTINLSNQGRELWKGKDVARLPAVYYFEKIVERHNLTSNKLLSFGCANDFEVQILPHDIWHDYDYWSNNKEDKDIEKLHLYRDQIDHDYDFCMVNQTFEHLTEIELAIQNITDCLKPGGYFYSNWPVLNIPHDLPYFSFTGISPMYIIHTFLKCGLEIIDCGWWGNTDYINYIYNKLSWPDYTEISLTNNIKTPCIGWILGRKK